jgi:hypothetical protein
MTSTHELAQLNIARMREPLDSPLMSDFVANIDRINALADGSPGFIWRLDEAYGERPLGANTLINISVWRDVAALSDYVHKSGHVEVLRRRRDWFERMSEAYAVLWWVPAGHRPSISEALERLELLRSKGATAEAFSFAARFDPPVAAP